MNESNPKYHEDDLVENSILKEVILRELADSSKIPSYQNALSLHNKQLQREAEARDRDREDPYYNRCKYISDHHYKEFIRTLDQDGTPYDEHPTIEDEMLTDEILNTYMDGRKSVLKILSQRSHYDTLALGACNVDSDEAWFADASSGNGWETNFDGGGNIHNPNEFAVCIAKASYSHKTKEETGGIEEVLLARRHERFSQNVNDKDYTYYLRHKKSEELDGTDLYKKKVWGPIENHVLYNTGGDTRVSFLRDDVSEFEYELFEKELEENWELVEPADIEERYKTISTNTINNIRSLYGQGGDFCGDTSEEK